MDIGDTDQNKVSDEDIERIKEQRLKDIADYFDAEEHNKEAEEYRKEKIKQIDEQFGFNPNPQRDPSDPKSTINQAADDVCSKFRFVTFEENDKILCYDESGVYDYGGEIIIRKYVEARFKDKATIHLCREVLDHVRRRTYRKRMEFDTDANIINLKNGLYYVLEDRLDPHTPDYLSLKQKPIEHNRHAPIPKECMRFLRTVTYRSDTWTLIELMAYTFHRKNPYDIICTLLGGGDNGKSVFSSLMTGLHGNRNVSHVPLKDIAESQFALADLVDKDVNIDEERSMATINDTAKIKKITGKEPTRVEPKYEKAFDAYLYTKLFVCANKLPQTRDDSDAWFKRNIIIPFYKKFVIGCCADVKLTDKITTPIELSGMFNVLMHALRRILKDGKIFLNDLTVEQRREKYERCSDPIGLFIEEAIARPDEVPNDARAFNVVTKDALYAAYEQYCLKYKLPKQSFNPFCKTLKEVYQWDDGRETTGKRRRYWKSLTLTEDYIDVIMGAQDTLI